MARHTRWSSERFTYGYDCLDGLLRLTCVRSAPYAEHDQSRSRRHEGPTSSGWQDTGLAGTGERGLRRLNLHRRADELQAPREHVMDSAPGTQPWRGHSCRSGRRSLLLP